MQAASKEGGVSGYLKLGAMVLLCLSAMSAWAQSPKELRMMVWEGYAPVMYVKQFEAQQAQRGQPVTVNVKYVNTPEDFFSAIRMKEVDIISPTHNLIKDPRFDYIKKGLLLPLDTKKLHHFNELAPSLRSADYLQDDHQHVYGVPFASGPYALAYNAQRIANAPSSWQVLWEPSSAGKYKLVSDYYEVNIYITALAMGYTGKQIHNFDTLNQNDFKNKLKMLIKNSGGFWSGIDRADDYKNMSFMATWGFAFPELTQRGETWKMATPKEGTLYWEDSFMMGYSLKDNPELQAIAVNWLDFVSSPEYQANVVVRGIGATPSNINTKQYLSPQEVALYGVDDIDGLMRSRTPWPTIDSARDRNGLKMLWEEVSEGMQHK